MAANMAASSSNSKPKPATDCRNETDLLRWLSNVRQRHGPSSTTTNCIDMDSKCLVPELIRCVQHSSRFVCYAASAALRCVLHSLTQDDLRKTMEELLMLPPACAATERPLPLTQQLRIETVTSFMKETKMDLHALNWSCLIHQWKLCVLECYSCPYLIVPSLTLTKRIWKSDLSGMYKHAIASHCELIVGLCKHCSRNVEVKKLLRICQYLLQSSSGSEEGGEDCLKLIVEGVFSSEVFTKRLSHWAKQCVGTDLSSLPVLQSLPRDCSDKELLPTVIRRSVLLVLQGVASLLALDGGGQKAQGTKLEQTCRLVEEAAVSEWRGMRNVSVPTHMELGRVLLYLISEEDSVLMECLLLCTQIHILLDHMDQTGAQYHFPGSLALLLSAADPHHMFVGFLDSVAFDHSTLMEFIATEDVKFMNFFTEYLHYTVVTWDQFVDVCQQHCDTVTSVLGLRDSSSDDNDDDSCGSGDWEGDHETDFQQVGLELDAGMKGTELGSPSPKRVCVDLMDSCSSLESHKSPPPVTPPSPPTDVSCAVLESDKSPPPVTPPSAPTDVSCAVLESDKSAPPVTPPSPPTDTSCTVSEGDKSAPPVTPPSAPTDTSCTVSEGDKSAPPVTPPSPPTDTSCAVLEAVMQCFAQLHLMLGNMAAKGLLQETQTVYELLQGVLERFSTAQRG